MEQQIVVTSVVRLSDGLPLVSGAEPSAQSEETRSAKSQMKKVLASLSKGTRETEACVSLGSMYVLYLIQGNVVFAGLFVKAYSQQFATAYLSELKKEFFQKYDERRVAQASVAFALMDFEKFLDKTKRAFEQSKSSRHLSQAQGNLTDIQRVMQRSLSEVVNRGEDISQLGFKSDQVLAESETYRKASAELNRMKWWQKWGVVAAVVIVIIVVFYVRGRFF